MNEANNRRVSRELVLGLDLVVSRATSSTPAIVGGDDLLVALLAEWGLSQSHDWGLLLARDTAIERQRLIAATLARLMAHDCIALDGVQERPRIVRFVGETLGKQLDIDMGRQGFELEAGIVTAVRAIEGELARNVSVPDLALLGQVRQRLSKAINSKAAKAVIRPFLPDQLINLRLQQLFESCSTYADATGESKLDARERASDVITAFHGDSQGFATTYSTDYLVTLTQQLSLLIDADFEGSEYSKPAALAVGPTEKHYPLSIAGVQVDLLMNVRNTGSGLATQVSLEIDDATDNIDLAQADVFIGRIGGGEVLAVALPATVVAETEIAMVSGRVTWTNMDSSVSALPFDVTFGSQRADIPWTELSAQEPYSLEPAEGEGELVGRAEILSRLLAEIQKPRIGSSFLHGQKRVGKTSIVRTLQSEIDRQGLPGLRTVYLEGGEYVDPDPEETLRRLGHILSRSMRASDPRLAETTLPEFRRALSPLVEFMSDVAELAPDLRFILILDEFDELPVDLFRRGPLGDSFFLALRTLSGRPNVGLVLVGGEKMELILSAQGDQLNKLRAIRVDYFDRGSHWQDFTELVRGPVRPWLEFSESALERIYSLTAGNPFFTKHLCGAIYRKAVERRDADITEIEVDQARQTELAHLASNSFQHFWEDGILDSPERVEQVSIDRRKVLLGLARIIRGGNRPTRSSLRDEAEALELGAAGAQSLIDDFIRRQVLLEVGGEIHCKVGLFEAWLVDRGPAELLTVFMDPDSVERLRMHDQEAFVTSEEIVTLVERWPTYKGLRITEDRVRVWLNQFGDMDSQRPMFQLLQHVAFWSPERIRVQLASAHEIIRRGIKFERVGKERKLREILISFIHGPGKSGATYARLYADENDVLADRVVDPSDIGRELDANPTIQAVVFVDDFVGTGQSAIDYFEQSPDLREVLARHNDVRQYFIALTGFGSGSDRLQEYLGKAGVGISVRVGTPLGAPDRAFDDRSPIFSDAMARANAREIAQRSGRMLQPKQSLGYGGLEALVVFDQSIPNNSLPILWAEKGSWRALFPRH